MREIRKILRRVLREREINIALLMGNYAAFVSIPAMIFSKTKFIYCDHGALINQIHETAITLIRFLNCFFATKLVVLTEKTKYDYKKYFHVRDSKICVMPNWIDAVSYTHLDVYKRQTILY